MWGRRKKRLPLERLHNTPCKILVGAKHRPEEQTVLLLREPYMYDMLEFFEGSIEKLVPVYSQKWAAKQVEKIAKAGKVDAGAFRLFKPAFEPICDFIAECADRVDLKGKLHRLLTPAQFTACINALLYLCDAEEMAVNFTQAQGRLTEAIKAMRQTSSAH
ncbi:hypothetical protein KKF61_07650 [Patescibacteria group bacterium]|nr:hypothetical protein [Patescibacteria group bacterium]